MGRSTRQETTSMHRRPDRRRSVYPQAAFPHQLRSVRGFTWKFRELWRAEQPLREMESNAPANGSRASTANHVVDTVSRRGYGPTITDRPSDADLETGFGEGTPGPLTAARGDAASV